MGFCSSVGMWDEQTAGRFSKCKVKSVLSKGTRSPVLFLRCPARRAPCASHVAPVLKDPPVNAGDIRDLGLIHGSGRSPGRGQGNPLQYSLGTSLVAQMVKNLPAVQETWVQSLGQEDPWRRAWQPTPVFLPGKFHEQRSLVGYCPYGHKELDTIELLTLALSYLHQKQIFN